MIARRLRVNVGPARVEAVLLHYPEHVRPSHANVTPARSTRAIRRHATVTPDTVPNAERAFGSGRPEIQRAWTTA
jgi:hypothetical protein